MAVKAKIVVGHLRVETDAVYELIDIRRISFGRHVAVMRCSGGEEVVLYVGDKLAINLDMEVTEDDAN